MNIYRFARQEWQAGNRDPETVTDQYITEALASDDPQAAFQSAVRELVSAAFGQFRRRIEDRVLMNTRTAPLGVIDWPRSFSQTKFHKQDHSRHEDWLELLETEVWISGKGMVPWADVTTADIEETIEAYELHVAGMQQRIRKLEAARKLMQDYDVSRFGDIPAEQVKTVIAMPV